MDEDDRGPSFRLAVVDSEGDEGVHMLSLMLVSLPRFLIFISGLFSPRNPRLHFDCPSWWALLLLPLPLLPFEVTVTLRSDMPPLLDGVELPLPWGGVGRCSP